jgi:poly-gamma-glutamate synthesis protein (capsule biosynthesis protein)
MNFAGDVNFAERTATRLAADPNTAFGVAAAPLGAADLTMVNLETAITTRGAPEQKSFTFRAPPTAFTALRAAGVDIATMANNHAADYGTVGLQDTLAAISAYQFPTVGIGADAAAAYAPYYTTVRGTKVAVIAASQVQDETLAHFTAGPSSPGIASAYSPALIQSVQTAKARGYLVIVYLHWGTEYNSCPNSDQTGLATTLAQAGATAVIGTHAHVLQGAGWRADGVYVAYGLSNYLWWRSFGNDQDDNGILTLTFAGGRVVASRFQPAHLDDTGVPVPATGATLTRLNAEWTSVRTRCTDLLPTPPR